MEKREFLSKIDETHQDYRSILETLSVEQFLQPATCGMWSVRDVIVHVTWYEREMIGMLKERALVGSELWNLPLEERNAAIHAAHRDRMLPEVLAESESIHRAMMDLLEGLTEADLHSADRFREMPPDWIPWQVIASNTFEHYPEHSRDIRRAFPLPQTDIPTWLDK